MVSDLAFHLASRGWEVRAIASRQLYDDAQARLPGRDTAKGVHIRRIWSTHFGRAGLAGRAVDYLTFYLSAFLAIRRERDAIVVAMTDPPLLSVVAAAASRRVVNWVQDLFPEVAEALGIRLPLLKGVRDWSLRRARANVVLGDLMAARVPKATVIANWADAGLRPEPAAPHDRFLVAYSGNLGRAHEFESIIGAMRRLPEVRFVFTGGGAQLESVKREAPGNAEFRPYVRREDLSVSLSAADAHLVSLRPALEGLIVPSKFYGILAVARPMIFIGARDGELGRIIERERCGVVVEAGDVEGLAAAIRMLAADRAAARAMGERGRELYLRRYAPQHAFAAWESILKRSAE